MTTPDRKLSPVWGRLVAVAFAGLLLLLLEGLATLAYREDRLDAILALLEQDPVLFWRQRPRLKAALLGQPVRTDAEGFRCAAGAPAAGGAPAVACFGASPTFGFGAAFEDAYPARLEALLRERMGTAAPRVMNAGQIGYSTHQGLLLLERQLARLQPRIVTVSYVLNDIDRYRFFRSNGLTDAETQAIRARFTRARNLLRHSRLVQLFGRAATRASMRRGGGAGRLYRAQSVRVPEETYRDNLRAAVALIRRHGAAPVLIEMPVNLPLAPPPATDAAERLEVLRGEAVRAMGAERWPQAVALLEESVRLDPHEGDLYTMLATAYARLGRGADAQRCYGLGRDAEAYRCARDGRRYNAILAEVAAEQNVPLVNVVAAFARHTNEYLFVSAELDPIHPNARGHAIIADRLLATLDAAGLLAPAADGRPRRGHP